MPQILFTLGYQKRSIEEFVELLRDASVKVLVDVRQTAWSHKPGFSKNALRDALAHVGIEYVHAAFAGNPRGLRTAARSHIECLNAYREYLDASTHVLTALEELLEAMLKAGKRVCLTCYERHPHDCHRGVLAAAWARRPGRRVEHLATSGCERLATR